MNWRRNWRLITDKSVQGKDQFAGTRLRQIADKDAIEGCDDSVNFAVGGPWEKRYDSG